MNIDVDLLIEMGNENLREGVGRALLGQIGSDFKSVGREVSDWTKSAREKQRALGERTSELIEWLRDQDRATPGMHLSQGAFKTWLKTSEFSRWRYFFVLHDATYGRIVASIKKGEPSQLEQFTNLSLSDRQDVTSVLDGIKTIRELERVVSTYAERGDRLFSSMLAQSRPPGGAPFQILLLGFTDLEATVKKIVNLAK